MENQIQSIRSKFKPGAIIGGMEIINKIENKNRYQVKCLKCNEILDVHEDTLRRRLKNLNEYGCSRCMKQKQYREQYIHKSGEIVGDYQLIEPYTKEGQKGMWKVKCLKCGSELVISYTNALKRKRSGCYYCNPGKGQLVPKKGNESLHQLKPLIKTRDECFYTNYKNKIESLNNRSSQGTGRKYKEWKLSLDDFSEIIHQNCYYCGQPPVYKKEFTRVNFPDDKLYANGIDRIDSNKGYTKDNCVPCCTICNRMKQDLSVQEFYDHIKQILNYSNMCSTTIETTSNDGKEQSTLQVNGNGNGDPLTKEDDIV